MPFSRRPPSTTRPPLRTARSEAPALLEREAHCASITDQRSTLPANQNNPAQSPRTDRALLQRSHDEREEPGRLAEHVAAEQRFRPSWGPRSSGRCVQPWRAGRSRCALRTVAGNSPVDRWRSRQCSSASVRHREESSRQPSPHGRACRAPRGIGSCARPGARTPRARLLAASVGPLSTHHAFRPDSGLTGSHRFSKSDEGQHSGYLPHERRRVHVFGSTGEGSQRHRRPRCTLDASCFESTGIARERCTRTAVSLEADPSQQNRCRRATSPGLLLLRPRSSSRHSLGSSETHLRTGRAIAAGAG